MIYNRQTLFMNPKKQIIPIHYPTTPATPPKFPLQNGEMDVFPLISLEDDLEEDGNTPATNETYGNELPIIVLRNNVMFPGVVSPLSVSRERSIKAIKNAYSTHKFIGVLTQKDTNIEDPNTEDLFHIGTIARVARLLKMPDGTITVIIHGKERFSVKKFITEEPFIKATYNILPTYQPKPREEDQFEAYIQSIQEVANQIIEQSPNIPSEASIVLKNIEKLEPLTFFIAANLSNIEIIDKQHILEINNTKKRAELLLKFLHRDLQMSTIKGEIQGKVQEYLDKQQREFFLQQQIKTIQDELDGDATDIVELKQKATTKKWNKQVKTVFEKELNKLKRTNNLSPDYPNQYNYLETLIELPWEQYTTDNFDLQRAEKILDKEHYGLEKIKKRILEYLAVLKLKGDMKSPILCLVGPPGVGKTSLGQAIAKSLQRQYVRMSLGGLHDESEIRGHRKTYIGAMPGRIIQGIKKAKSSNPVFILDEIDKVGKDFRGDPSSALLEVLDPEQNTSFQDNYLELEYDLSKVLFIATANNPNTIQPALLDRMEIIELSGYSTEEKIEIAKKYLIPKQKEAHGLNNKDIKITDKLLDAIINNYTRESGVRELERKIAAIMRYRAKAVATNEPFTANIDPATLKTILGVSPYDNTLYTDENPIGVSIGLAWTAVGGEILFIETALSNGSGKLTFTGNLGNIMQESVTTALTYLKANADILNIDSQLFTHKDFHLHVPEGAIPKDGPSAGIAILTALASVLTHKKIKPYTSLTGEITLRGKVLPVGGIKEKILAAKRSGIKEIILCYLNQKDVDEINPEHIKNLQFHYVKNMQEVLYIALQ